MYKEYSENLPEPVKVLKNLNVKIFRGEFVCLMGPSGSGKSTLLNMLGLLRQSQLVGLFLLKSVKFQNLLVLKRQSYVIHRSVLFFKVLIF